MKAGAHRQAQGEPAGIGLLFYRHQHVKMLIVKTGLRYGEVFFIVKSAFEGRDRQIFCVFPFCIE